MVRSENKWWFGATLYEIYLRSFQDANGDGIGDLRGVLSRLGYLEWLGVDALWLTSFYQSPQLDFGYDISDHQAVDPLYGSLEEFDQLVAEVHRRGMRIIVDYVPCHTSSRHPWFEEARAGKSNPKRDWYLWQPPRKDGSCPNNWRSEYGTRVWQFDDQTDQYYFHHFLPEQPGLNWRNPEVQAAMLDVLRFWLERGVDGFRCDAIHRLVQDAALRDNPPNFDYTPNLPPQKQVGQAFTDDQAETHTLIARMRALIEEYSGRLLIGEMHLPATQLVRYYGRGHGLHFPLNYLLVGADWKAPEVRKTLDEFEGLRDASDCPGWALSNHDQERCAARLGPEQARVAAMLQLTLPGMPTVYYGDELGLVNHEVPIELMQDPAGKALGQYGLWRDPHRTPMQWSAADHAGFSTGRPWLPVATDYAEINVEKLRGDKTSILQLYRQLIQLRRSSTALQSGLYRPVATDLQTFLYLVEDATESFLICLNLTKDAVALKLEKCFVGAAIVLSTKLDRQELLTDRFVLRGHEGVIARHRTAR